MKPFEGFYRITWLYATGRSRIIIRIRQHPGTRARGMYTVHRGHMKTRFRTRRYSKRTVPKTLKASILCEQCEVSIHACPAGFTCIWAVARCCGPSTHLCWALTLKGRGRSSWHIRKSRRYRLTRPAQTGAKRCGRAKVRSRDANTAGAPQEIPPASTPSPKDLSIRGCRICRRPKFMPGGKDGN